MRTHGTLTSRYVTFEPNERVQLVVGRRVGVIVVGPTVVDWENIRPGGAPTVTQLVRWDDTPDAPVAWETWTLRPERTTPEPLPVLGGCQ